MIKFFKIALTFAILFVIQNFSGQEKIVIGEKLNVHSKILNENREVWIHLPKRYSDTAIEPAKYPVIYLLDAEFNFDYYSGMVDYLSKSPYALIPESIVVGIKNSNRTKDLTPSKASKKSPVNGKMLFEESGGGEHFLQFIQQELKPFINQHFRTIEYSVFVGHSFGGLSVLYCMAQHPDYFNSYIANDPSLWWDNEFVFKKTENYLKEHQNTFPKNIKLYLAQADNEEQNKIWKKDMIEGIENFNALIQKNGSLHYSFKFYQNEDHGTISYSANFDALRFVYKGFQTDIKQLVQTPELLEKQYDSFSQQTGFQWKPSETYLNILIKFAKENGFTESQTYFETLKTKWYSKSF